MIEYQLVVQNTGDHTLYNNRAYYSSNYYAVNNESGLLYDFSLNGQNMLLTDPVVTRVGEVLSIASSGYGYALSGKIFLTLPVSGSDIAYYDTKPSGHNPFFSAETNAAMIAGFTTEIGTNLGNYNVYLNGIKLTSGESYNYSAGFNYLDSDTSTTGTLFGVFRPSNSIDVTGYYDLLGYYSIKGMDALYLNGARLMPNLYGHFYSGIATKINPGKSSYVASVNNNVTLSI